MKESPPKAVLRFFRWYCHPKMHDYIEGDLIEVYERRRSKLGKRKADLLFIIDVLRLFRPGIIRPFKEQMYLNNHGMIKNHFRIGWRNIAARKAFALINISGLALGLGCSIIIYLFINHHLQFDYFHNNVNRIYRVVTEEHRDRIDYSANVPPGFANAFKADYHYAERVAKMVTMENQLITIDGGKMLKEDVVFVEADFFSIFNFPIEDKGTQPSLTKPNNAFMAESTARKIFGEGDPVGKIFQLENKEFITVIGLLKDLPKTTLIKGGIFVSFETLKKYDEFLSSEKWGGISSDLQCFVQLYPNQNVAEIEQAIAGYVKKYRPTSKNVHHYLLQPLTDVHFNPKYYGGINPTTLWIFSSIGFFLLVVACINFINISTAQSTRRSKEVGVRKVLGSQRELLFWQFMTETVMITLASFILGLVAVTAVLPYFNSVFTLDLSIRDLLTLRFLTFASLTLIGVAFISGSYPGILLSRIAPLLALKGKLTTADTGGMFTRRALVVTQFVISIVLIIGTIVINKQIDFAIHSDLGFDKSAVVMVSLPERLETPKLEALKSRISQHSGIEKISACFASPGAGDSFWDTSLQYHNNPESEDFSIHAKMADKDYLKTFDLKLLAGRNFYEKDTIDEILVNATFAKFVNVTSPEELLGKTLTIDGGYVKATIVGVVSDFHDGDFHQDINPIFIAPVKENYLELAIKINMRNSQEVLHQIEKEWSAVFPNMIFEYSFLDDRIAAQYDSEQRFLSLTRLFSVLTLFIGCLGIYGLIVFITIQRTKEIGIRKVLGGNTFHILGLLTTDFLKLLTVAGVLAIPMAWYLMNRWLEDYNYKTEISWWVFVLAIGTAAIITLFTVSYQTIKASLANPVNSLRSE